MITGMIPLHVSTALTTLHAIEAFYADVALLPLAPQYAIEMQRVDFVKPCGVIALVMATRHLSARSGRPVELRGLREQVHHYLQRMDLFRIAGDWLATPVELGEEWTRSLSTRNLLELTQITGPVDVEKVVDRAEHIFEPWLQTSDLRSIMNVLSELCANTYQHSGGQSGCVLIQKYELAGGVVINVAVADAGQGVPNSLTARHGHFGDEPLDYLRAAMQGRTARTNGRGGLGLRTVQDITSSSGGYVWLRSDTASIQHQGNLPVIERRNLAPIPGTQVIAEYRAPWQL